MKTLLHRADMATAKQKLLLREQGHLFSRPLDPQAFARWLEGGGGGSACRRRDALS